MYDHPDAVLITERLLHEAETAFLAHWKKEAFFNRSIFFDSFCREGCPLCYLTPQSKETTVMHAKRSVQSLLAEAHLCKQLNWKASLVGDARSRSVNDLITITKSIALIMEERSWITSGSMSRNDLELLKPYTEGIVAPLETVNRDLFRSLCPRKELAHLITVLNETPTKRGISIYLGVGESMSDIDNLFGWINNNNLDRVVFLNPALRAQDRPAPSSFYIARWIAETRIAFPQVEIIVDAHPLRAVEVSLFLKAGANQISGFPAVQLFNSESAKIIVQEAETAGRLLRSNLTETTPLKAFTSVKADSEIKDKLEKYRQILERKK